MPDEKCGLIPGVGRIRVRVVTPNVRIERARTQRTALQLLVESRAIRVPLDDTTPTVNLMGRRPTSARRLRTRLERRTLQVVAKTHAKPELCAGRLQG